MALRHGVRSQHCTVHRTIRVSLSRLIYSRGVTSRVTPTPPDIIKYLLFFSRVFFGFFFFYFDEEEEIKQIFGRVSPSPPPPTRNSYDRRDSVRARTPKDAAITRRGGRGVSLSRRMCRAHAGQRNKHTTTGGPHDDPRNVPFFFGRVTDERRRGPTRKPRAAGRRCRFIFFSVLFSCRRNQLLLSVVLNIVHGGFRVN